MINKGQHFPYRNLILFITFIVILVTLVLQGLTLPWLIRKVNLEDKYSIIPHNKQEVIIQKKIAKYSMKYLEEKYNGNQFKNDHVHNLYTKLKLDLNFFDHD